MKLIIRTKSKSGKCSWLCNGKKYLKEQLIELVMDGYEVIEVVDKNGKLIK